MSLGFRHIAPLACTLALVACGSSLDPDEKAAPGDPSAAAAGTPSGDSGGGSAGSGRRSTGGGGGQGRDEPSRRNADGSPVELTGAELCADLPPASASQALGVGIDSAVPGDTATPQCTYSYTNPAGDDSTFTLAAMRPADIGGRTGLEAFDYMVGLSRELAGPVDLDERDLGVGDKAVRITGGQLHTAVLATGGHLLTLTVPESDADADAVDALATTVARALA